MANRNECKLNFL